MSLESADCIHIQGLELSVRIGVPDEERAGWQTLQADLTLRLHGSFEDMQDDLTKTVDYSAVALDLRSLAAVRPRQLIETLAAEIASFLLSEYPIASVTLQLRKRILPGCDFVSVSLTRSVGV